MNLALWLLETTGSSDAAALKAELEIEYRLLYNDPDTYQKLLQWDREKINDPLLKRQLNVLIRTFKPNMIQKELLESIAQQEAAIGLQYSTFRPLLGGKQLTENEIRERLKKENDPVKRKEVWEASKEIGKVLGPSILKLVKMRNEAAKSSGYANYFTMQLDLQEIDEKWLFDIFDKLSETSDGAYSAVLNEVHKAASKRFKVPVEELGPWAWSDPFCQEDPNQQEIDDLVKDVDILELSRSFFEKMGLNVDAILKRSDNFEREGKNQHAFCFNIDREDDVRTLNNIKPTLKWLEIVLHELGHAVYEVGYGKEMPWLLREPAHIFTTEAMALLAGRQAYRKKSLQQLLNSNSELMNKAEDSLRRRQMIFSRWVLVMTYFERELYSDPDQDLNSLWWKLVEKHQKIKCKGSKHGFDWAAKGHIGLAPAYYYSYLLGELFASAMEEKIDTFASPQTGQFFAEKLFKPANSLPPLQLVQHVIEAPLSATAWLNQFTQQMR